MPSARSFKSAETLLPSIFKSVVLPSAETNDALVNVIPSSGVIETWAFCLVVVVLVTVAVDSNNFAISSERPGASKRLNTLILRCPAFFICFTDKASSGRAVSTTVINVFAVDLAHDANDVSMSSLSDAVQSSVNCNTDTTLFLLDCALYTSSKPVPFAASAVIPASIGLITFGIKTQD